MFVGVARRSLRFLAAMTFMAAALCSGHGPSLDIDQPTAARPMLAAAVQQVESPVVATPPSIPASVLVTDVHFGAPAPLPPSVPASAWLPAGGADVSPHGQRAPPVV